MNSAKRISNQSVKTETKTNNETNVVVDKKKGLIKVLFFTNCIIFLTRLDKVFFFFLWGKKSYFAELVV